MTAEEKIEHQRQLLKIKSDFLAIGVEKMPLKEIKKLMPDGLSVDEAFKWSSTASNVWNGRSSEYEKFLPIFELALEKLKDTETIIAK